MKKGLIGLSLLIILINKSNAQINPAFLQKTWDAFWISSPDATPHTFSVQYFRKEFNLAEKPDKFIIHVSADNRYKLYVNGKIASLGPARGELYHWYFETVDIASFLKAGENIISAVVWNFGEESPEAQISLRTAFILQGNSAQEAVLNTNKTWLTYKDSSYAPLKPTLIYSYYVAGPGEQIDYRMHPGDWNNTRPDLKSWKPAQEILNGCPKGVFAWTDSWMLTPSNIPQMELKKQRFSKVARIKNITLPADFPSTPYAITIGPKQKVSFLLDQGQLTNAYPELLFSKGKDSRINIGYAEALYIDEGTKKDWRAQNKKGNRNDIQHKRFVGVKDQVIANGNDKQYFTPLSYRTFRYVEVDIETAEEALVVTDISSVFTGYPFEFNAAFEAGDDTLQRILTTGWRTARLCAMETYMDCPYYEQLQYVGDTRIQALVSLYNSGDDRLMRNAISHLDHSRMAEGITLSRYPTRHPQQIPPFSLWWIGMLHDYYMYRPDSNFVREHLPGMRQVLWFFSKYQEEDGSLKKVPYWNFTDWCESPGWQGGVAPIGKNGLSAALDLQLLWAYQLASELESKLGMKANSDAYQQAAQTLQTAIRKKYWHGPHQLFADTEDKNSFSQHVNTLAILTGTTTPKETESLVKNLLYDTTLAPATIYFKYYVHLALIRSGLGNQYLEWLETWRENLRMGMTTWAEISDINAARSDCHAWGSSPNIEFFRTVLGIDTDAPGFKKVRIEPRLGKLQSLKGKMPHPAGVISVEYRVRGSNMEAIINLPPDISGKFIWKNKQYQLNPGSNKLKFYND